MKQILREVLVRVLGFLLISASLWSARITDIKKDPNIHRVAVYVGTFNPFHLGHEHIVNNLLEHEKFDAVIVIPNYYTFHKPFTLKWANRLELLEARYYEHPKVYLPIERAIRPPEIVDFLRNEVKQKLSISYVAGSDVIEDWKARFWVNNFLIDTADEILVVGQGIEDEQRKNAIMLFNTPVRFTNWSSSPIRGSSVRREIELNGVSDNLRNSIHPRILQRSISTNLYQLHTKLLNTTNIEVLKKDLVKEFKIRVKPVIDEKLSEFGTKLDWSEGFIEKLIWVNIEDFTEFTQLQHDVYIALKNKERIPFSAFSEMFLNEHILQFYQDLSLQLKELKPVRYQGLHESYFHTNLGLIHRIAKTLSPLKDFLIHFENIKLEDDSALKTKEFSTAPLRLYRGFKIPPNMNKDEFIEALMTQGSLSSIARDSLESGMSWTEAVATSEAYLASEGATELVINHVLGSWRRSSSLVSATTDRDLAKSFAGEGGIVIEILTTSDRVIFMNEEAYWKNSPFAKSGNPRFLQAEVAIKNVVMPYEIVSVEAVDDLIVAKSNYNIRKWQFVTSLKALLWTNYLRAKQFTISRLCKNSFGK